LALKEGLEQPVLQEKMVLLESMAPLDAME
jgi:hypothetical protein